MRRKRAARRHTRHTGRRAARPAHPADEVRAPMRVLPREAPADCDLKRGKMTCGDRPSARGAQAACATHRPLASAAMAHTCRTRKEAHRRRARGTARGIRSQCRYDEEKGTSVGQSPGGDSPWGNAGHVRRWPAGVK